MATAQPNSPLTAEQARALLDYDPVTGIFTWRHRTGGGRTINTWNARYAGKEAGCVQTFGRPDRWYRTIYAAGKLHYAHRLAWLYMKGEWPPPGMRLDHIDGNGLNNRIANLRLATSRQNSANTRTNRNNRSGFKGVFWETRSAKWTARIKRGEKKVHLGYFDTPEEAHAAYRAAATETFGEFARGS